MQAHRIPSSEAGRVTECRPKMCTKADEKSVSLEEGQQQSSSPAVETRVATVLRCVHLKCFNETPCALKLESEFELNGDVGAWLSGLPSCSVESKREMLYRVIYTRILARPAGLARMLNVILWCLRPWVLWPLGLVAISCC